jgi:hypothetical protein
MLAGRQLAKILIRFNVTIASLIWSITSLLFAVKGQKTAKLWLFLRRLDLQKAGVSAAESSWLAVFSLQITAKTATTRKVSELGVRAASYPICAFSRLTSCAWQLRRRRRLQWLLQS